MELSSLQVAPLPSFLLWCRSSSHNCLGCWFLIFVLFQGTLDTRFNQKLVRGVSYLYLLVLDKGTVLDPPFLPFFPISGTSFQWGEEREFSL